MNYIDYEAFLHTLQHGSLTRAGDALGYTQSGISHLLNGLEQSFGVPLLFRDRSGVSLTSEGKILLPYLESICAQQHELEQMLEELREGRSGLIRIAAHTSIAGQWLPSIFQAFQKQFPKTAFELHEVTTSQEVLDLVRKKTVDCGIFTSSVLDQKQLLLHVEQLVAVLPTDHELARAPYFPMDALDVYPYIRLEEPISSGDTYSACVEQIFTTHNKSPKINLLVRNEYTALAMIAAKQGFCILPNMTKDRTRHELCYLPLERPFYRYTSLAVADGREERKLIQHFVTITQGWIKQHYAEEDSLKA